MKNLLWLFSALLLHSALTASPTIDTVAFEAIENRMNELSRRILRDTSQAMRTSSSEELEKLFEEALSEEGSFNYSFEDVRGISITQPEDNAFRIFTWQLYVDKDHYDYKGFVQLADGSYHRLNDNSAEMRQPEFDKVSPKDWYGALYYNVKPFKNAEGKKMYLLFGFDAYSFFSRRKVLDVFYLDHKGRPRFGSNVLEIKDGWGRLRTVYRFILQYSASVSVSLNYSEADKMVVYDHLINGDPLGTGAPTNVPDGSYHGLELKGGMWKLVDKVHTEDPYYGNDNPPVEEPVLGDKKKKRNLFGHKRKNFAVDPVTGRKIKDKD